VINQAFARQFFDQRSPLGLHVTAVDDDGSRQPCEVVGIVGDARTQNLRETVESRYFLASVPPAAPTFLIRTRGQQGQVIASLRAAVQRYDAGLTITDSTSLDEQMAPLTAQDRATARLALVFGIVALSLAAMGLYGILSYATSTRLAEIAVRIAVGAAPARVITMILVDAAAVVVLGVLTGAAFAYAGTRLLASRLYGVAPQDSLTVALAICALLIVAFFAAYVPAARASRTDPVALLR